METRLILAYGLMALLALGTAVFAAAKFRNTHSRKTARERVRDQKRREARTEKK